MTYTSYESEIPTDDPGYRKTHFVAEDSRSFNWTLLILEIVIVTVGILNLVSATTVQDKSMGLYRAQVWQTHYSAQPNAFAQLADWNKEMIGFWESRIDDLEDLLRRMDQ